jgi:anti-sigma factor RsiW
MTTPGHHPTPGGGLPEMPCRELVEVITDYLDGALPPEDRLRFDAHLAECPPCTEYVEQFRHTIATAGRLEADQLSPATREALLQAFRGWSAR